MYRGVALEHVMVVHSDLVVGAHYTQENRNADADPETVMFFDFVSRNGNTFLFHLCGSLLSTRLWMWEYGTSNRLSFPS